MCIKKHDFVMFLAEKYCRNPNPNNNCPNELTILILVCLVYKIVVEIFGYYNLINNL